jgi:hypothetical protein
MNRDRFLALFVALIVITCSILIINYFIYDPLRNLQSLTDSLSTQLVSSNVHVSDLHSSNTRPGSVLVVWSNSGKLCTEIQKLIPVSFWPKNIADVEKGYIVSITRGTGEEAEYGTIGDYIKGYQVVYQVSVICSFSKQSSGQMTQQVDNKTFLGAALPYTVKVGSNDNKPYYGAPPSSSDIADWIKNISNIE